MMKKKRKCFLVLYKMCLKRNLLFEMKIYTKVENPYGQLSVGVFREANLSYS